MRTKKLGWTEMNFTVVGFGSWAMGGGGWKFSWGPQNDQESIAAIHRAIDLGVNWIDTAPVYGLGHSEEIVGKAVRGMSSRPLIATKCGLVWDEKGNITNCLKKESVRREVEASLKRLGIETIDLYQIHWPIPDEDIEEAWAEMARLVEEGKVRYIGVSNFSAAQMRRIEKIHPIASLQPPYSMLRRGIEGDILPYCAEKNIGVIAYSPMQKGLLTGAITRERIAQLPPDDHRRNDPQFQEPELSINLEFVEKLKPIAEKYGKTVAQLAIAWVLRRPEVTSAIVGVRRPAQIEETAPAADFELSSADLESIEELLRERERKVSTLSGR